ncbi:glycosyltransferase [Candidatus Dojkabacteria bacterium]|nr:glycosyltransferase [Candidatus Dojkabacteria bacterium]
MISIIITSYKEPRTIGKAILAIADPAFSGITGPFEVIQVSPDQETLDAGLKAAKKLKLGKSFKLIKDVRRGKPYALKLAFKEAKGDIVILTDGDARFQRNAVKEILKPFSNKRVAGVTGRPVARNKRDSFYGYMGNLLADSAHHRRTHTMVPESGYYISGDTFFPMSGYIMAVRRIIKSIPKDVLSDDAYISYIIRNKGFEIAYNPKAEVKLKYPTTLQDYYDQKVRSLGGFIQLEKYGIFKRDKQSRSFFIELPYALFVLTYPKSIRELYWSLLMFPTRLIVWAGIFVERVLLRKGMPNKGWKRIESTK